MTDNIGLATFNSAGIDSLVKSQLAAIRGLEQFSQYFFESARRNFETAIETNKRFAGVRTLAELAELQTKVATEFLASLSERNKTAADLGATAAQNIADSVETVAKNAATASEARKTVNAKAA